MENKGQKVKVVISTVTDTMRREGRGRIKSDVQGSYTGMAEGYEEPVQDADDL